METDPEKFKAFITTVFLSYLWGMETRQRILYLLKHQRAFYPTYEEWKPSISIEEEIKKLDFLSYLWGMETEYSDSKERRRANFLSYLWGMETFLASSYSFWVIYPFYPTYEEWKLGIKTGFNDAFITFYPTYEEWKQTLYVELYIPHSLFILPMRNGNSFSFHLLRRQI